MPRGQLILIEGLDRSGKSTQASLLVSKLGHASSSSSSSSPPCSSKLLKFPDRTTPIGKLINEYLTNKEFQLDDQAAHLLFLANRWELNQEIHNLLNQGCFVVLDRYIYSGIAYTLAKNNLDDSDANKSISRGKKSSNLASVDWLLGPDKGLPKPDLTMFLTLDLEEISKRKGWGNERYELQQFQAKVKRCFLQILNSNQDKSIEILDVGEKSIQEVTNQLWDVIVSHNANTLTEKPIEYI